MSNEIQDFSKYPDWKTYTTLYLQPLRYPVSDETLDKVLLTGWVRATRPGVDRCPNDSNVAMMQMMRDGMVDAIRVP